MLAAFEGFSGLEKFFAYCALIGGLFLLVRIVFQFIGVGGDHDAATIDSADASVGLDAGHADAANQHHGTDVGFKLMSMQGLTAFFLMFGLVGLALLRQSHVGPGWAIIGACAAGLATVWVMAQIFSSVRRIASSGNIDIRRAIGSIGTVYATIPPHTMGQVQITIQGRLRIYDAVAPATPAAVETGTRVKITDVISDNTLVVEKITDI